MNINTDNVVRAGAIVIIGGIVLLAITYLAEFFIPLIIGAVLLFIAYLGYRFLKTGGLNL